MRNKERVTSDTQMVDPNQLVLRPGGINEQKVGRFGKRSDKGTMPPPIVVFIDTDGTYYVADGNHRATAARQRGKMVPATVTEDDEYIIKGTNILTLILRMILGVRND